MDQNYQKGFTLIELLVVIAILGVLAIAVLFSINPAEALRKSRDSSRLQELTNLRKVIDATIATKTAEDILSTGSCPYATPCNSAAGSRNANGSGWLPIDLTNYVSVLPIDPLNNKTNVHIANGSSVTTKIYFATNGNVYTLALYLESTQNAPLLTSDGGSSSDLYETGTGLSQSITPN